MNIRPQIGVRECELCKCIWSKGSVQYCTNWYKSLCVKCCEMCSKLKNTAFPSDGYWKCRAHCKLFICWISFSFCFHQNDRALVKEFNVWMNFDYTQKKLKVKLPILVNSGVRSVNKFTVLPYVKCCSVEQLHESEHQLSNFHEHNNNLGWISRNDDIRFPNPFFSVWIINWKKRTANIVSAKRHMFTYFSCVNVICI